MKYLTSASTSTTSKADISAEELAAKIKALTPKVPAQRFRAGTNALKKLKAALKARNLSRYEQATGDLPSAFDGIPIYETCPMPDFLVLDKKRGGDWVPETAWQFLDDGTMLRLEFGEMPGLLSPLDFNPLLRPGDDNATST